MPKKISVEGNGHCCHRPSSNWETNNNGIFSTLNLGSLVCMCVRAFVSAGRLNIIIANLCVCMT